ncbi:MAG: alpha/beta fold hydrolase [Acidimicrobiales bacterium]
MNGVETCSLLANGPADVDYVDVDVAAMEPDDRGPALLLIHGLGCDRSIWDPLIPRLATRRRVLAVCCRGSGGSRPHDDVAWSTADMAGDVARLIEDRSLSSVDVIGLSMGGTVALQLALDRPELVGRLAVIGSFAGFADEVRPFLDAEMKRVAGESMRESAQRRIETAFSEDVDTRMLSWVVDMVARMHKPWYERQVAATFAFDVRNRLGEIMAPTTVIAGSADRTVPVEMVREVADGISHARFVELDEAGHFVHLEEPDRLIAALDGWGLA